MTRFWLVFWLLLLIFAAGRVGWELGARHAWRQWSLGKRHLWDR